MSRLARRLLESYGRLVAGTLTVLGLLGVLRGRFAGFFDQTGASVLWLQGNPLLHLTHLVVGLVGVAAAARSRSAPYALAVATGAAVLAILGFVVGAASDPFGRDRPMMMLHLVIGIAGLGLWAAARKPAPPQSASM